MNDIIYIYSLSLSLSLSSLSLPFSFPLFSLSSLCRFVEAYQKRFGSLPVSAAKKRQRSSRNDLQDLLVDCPLFMLTGVTPATMFIVLRESNPKTGK